MRRMLNRRAWIVMAGLVFGVLAALLVKWGNPPNMGVCAACFIRDVSGGLGLHRANTVQYLRPEIAGFVLGALAAALAFREFKSRGGSSPLVRFFLGAFVSIGALVFLGCPIRALARLAGGDLNGLTALVGLVAGVAVGIFFLQRGFHLGRASRMPPLTGWLMPIAVVGLLLLAIFSPAFIFASKQGPGSLHAALWVSLVVGLVVGVLAQRTRMCFVGGWRDVLMVGDTYLISGILAFFVAALLTNGALGSWHWGFSGQPIAHNNHLWNFLGMSLVGLCATLLGGCPLRQMVLSGEGDSDAGITVLGMVVGAAFSHNFTLASSPAGVTRFGPTAVVIGLVFAITVGFLMREKLVSARRVNVAAPGAVAQKESTSAG